MNQLFGSAVNIRAIGRSLVDVALRVEDMAYSGLLLAARLPTSRGAPLVVLTKQLTVLPGTISREVEEINAGCALVSNDLAASGALARLAAQYNDALKLMTSDQNGAGVTRDLVFRRASSTTKQSVAGLWSADSELRKLPKRLSTLRFGTREARQVARCIAVESAWVGGKVGSFRGLSGDINTVADNLDQLLLNLEEAIENGMKDVQSLIAGVQTN